MEYELHKYSFTINGYNFDYYKIFDQLREVKDLLNIDLLKEQYQYLMNVLEVGAYNADQEEYERLCKEVEKYEMNNVIFFYFDMCKDVDEEEEEGNYECTERILQAFDTFIFDVEQGYI